MSQPMPLSQVFGEPSRRFFFQSWWRCPVTVVTALLPTVTLIAPEADQRIQTWVGPASLAPLMIWVAWGVTRIRLDSTRGDA